MLQIRQHEKILVLGDYQTGKTTLARYILSQCPRWAAFDPTWAMRDDGLVVHDVAALPVELDETPRVVLQPKNPRAAFDEYCAWVLKQENLLCVIDEPALFLTPRDTMDGNFGALHRLGHKRGIGLALQTHRYSGDLPALCRVFHHLFIFRCSVNNDLEELAKLVGKDGAAWIREAPDYHFWYRGKGLNGPLPPVRWPPAANAASRQNAASDAANDLRQTMPQTQQDAEPNAALDAASKPQESGIPPQKQEG